MNIKGILFDLDGVLIDSETSYTRFWDSIEREFPTGIPDYALAIKGQTLSKILGNYPDAETRARIMDRIHDFESNMRYGINPGVIEFLSDIRAHGVKTAIVTSSDDVKMSFLFEQLPQLRPYFDCVVDGSMVSHSKPHPEPYLTGAACLDLNPRDCVVFEDSFQGMESGKAAGCAVVGVATTFPEIRVREHVHTVIDTFEDITLSRLREMLG